MVSVVAGSPADDIEIKWPDALPKNISEMTSNFERLVNAGVGLREAALTVGFDDDTATLIDESEILTGF